MTFPINPNQELSEIRSMMERSSRFISLSGIPGIITGLTALAGVFAAVQYFGVLQSVFEQTDKIYADSGNLTIKFILFLIADALIVATVAIGSAIYFTTRRARRNGLPAWTPTTKRLLISLGVPVLTGGAFCVVLLKNGSLDMILPASLIFYGLGLISASKHTLRDIRALGAIEIALGLCAGIFQQHGLLIWAVGFGLMHILYGSIMWFKYERKEIN